MNTTYPPRCDASKVAGIQTRRIFGPKSRAEDERLVGKVVCKFSEHIHMQIMTVYLSGMLIYAVDFASTTRASGCKVRTQRGGSVM
jgi:hypothetical protein